MHLSPPLMHVVNFMLFACFLQDDDGNNNWPDFLKYLFEWASSSDPSGREIALLLFGSVPGIFGNQQSRYVDVIHGMLSRSLTDESKKAQNEIAVVPDFHKRILFSDEAQFWLNGYVNKQNCRIWSEAQVYVETPLHPEKLTVWCALWAGGIIGPYFFKNDEGHSVTVNGDRYRAMITNFFIPELNNHDVQELWFQQDGATCHTARATIDLLKDTFGDRLISRFGPVNWPPRSCDLTPLDYFLWGYVKSLVYADKPQMLDHLEDNIRRVIADIRPQMLEKSSKIGRPDWTTSEPAVRYVAVRATCNFLLTNEKELQVLKQFVDCVNRIIEFFSQEVDSEGSEPEEILGHLVELIESCPSLFRENLNELLQLCFKTLTDSRPSESCKHLCLEVIVTLCEAGPSMIKKSAARQISVALSIILSMMTDIEEDDRWNYVDDDNSDIDNESTPVVAESALDRMACALGGKTVLPYILTTLPQMLQSVNWKERYAGLMALSTVGEGCSKQMTNVLPQIVDTVVPFLTDQHMRVRYAACNALGQMAADFATLFQKKFHEKVIPALCIILNNPASRRVQAHAGAALVNFFEDCPKNILSPYISSLVDALEKVLQETLGDFAESGSKLVLEQAVVTLASLADCAQEKFIDYYERFMPPLKHIIIHANEPRLGLLRGKTIECVSLIGLAVGKEKVF
ncbi:importin-5 [Trichonephila clavipes]|nr:importin-5 [Trichonephila clavipes]